MTKLIRCTCAHAYQDELYGAGNRMANEMRTGQLICTVCGAIAGTKSTAAPVAQADSPVKVEPPQKKSADDKKKSSERKKGPKAASTSKNAPAKKDPNKKASDREKKPVKGSLKGNKR